MTTYRICMLCETLLSLVRVNGVHYGEQRQLSNENLEKNYV